MTKICVYRKNEDIVKFTVSGHTGFAENGSDILCAAISALTYSTINGITDVVGISAEVTEDDAFLECILPDNISEKETYAADVLIASFLLSLKNLQKQYVGLITITELEV